MITIDKPISAWCRKHGSGHAFEKIYAPGHESTLRSAHLPLVRRRASPAHAGQSLLQITINTSRTHYETVKGRKLGAHKLIQIHEPRTTATIKADQFVDAAASNARAELIVVAILSRFDCRCRCGSKIPPEPIGLSLPLFRESLVNQSGITAQRRRTLHGIL